MNNRAVLWVHVAAAAASIRPPDLQRLFAFLISLFSWEFRSPYRRHLAFSLPFPPSRPRTSPLPSSEIYANTRNDFAPRNRFSQTVFARRRRRFICPRSTEFVATWKIDFPFRIWAKNLTKKFLKSFDRFPFDSIGHSFHPESDSLYLMRNVTCHRG